MQFLKMYVNLIDTQKKKSVALHILMTKIHC